MKITYIFKKGFQYYPPCLTQVLNLQDLGVELEVYHGENTAMIDKLLDERGITHYQFSKDIQSKNKFESGINLLRFMPEIRALDKKIPSDRIFWFGNCETAIAMGTNILKKRRFVISVLELYDEESFIGKQLAKFIKYAEAVVCCEPHRAAIMMSRHGLKKMPYVIANKPYELKEKLNPNKELIEELKTFDNKFIVVYQGNISPERPLNEIVTALNRLNDDSIYFFVLGKYFKGRGDSYIDKLKEAYKNTVFWGYVPAPEHLVITEKCHVGVANYDVSCLNTVFCAPNKIYEYSKYGLPMLCSQNIGLTETVGAANAAECVNFDNVDEIAKGLKKIKDNYELYSQNARKFYDEYDVKEKIAEVLAELENNDK